MAKPKQSIVSQWPACLFLGVFAFNVAHSHTYVPEDRWLMWIIYGISTVAFVLSITLFFISRKIAAEGNQNASTETANSPGSAAEQF